MAKKKTKSPSSASPAAPSSAAPGSSSSSSSSSSPSSSSSSSSSLDTKPDQTNGSSLASFQKLAHNANLATHKPTELSATPRKVGASSIATPLAARADAGANSDSDSDSDSDSPQDPRPASSDHHTESVGPPPNKSFADVASVVTKTVVTTKNQLDFLKTALGDVQETVRFLDSKAGLIVAFESALLGGVMFEASSVEILRAVFSQGIGLFNFIFAAALAAYSILVVYHVNLTLRCIFPSENPAAHVINGDTKPAGIFFIWQMDSQGYMRPSLPDYLNTLHRMNDDDLATELASQILKLSFIRKHKQDTLSRSFIWLFVLVIGFVAVQGLRLVAHLGHNVQMEG